MLWLVSFCMEITQHDLIDSNSNILSGKW